MSEPVAPPPTPQERLHWLDSLRALAALWVVAHHAYLAVPFPSSNLALAQLGRFLAHGTLAVTAFIALSGYSLVLPTLRRGGRLRAGYGEFVLSRFIRIVPPYLIAVALTLVGTLLHLTLLGERLSPAQWQGLGGAALKHLLLIQDLDGTDLIALPGWSNGVFWTIAVEFKIYLLFPAMLWAYRQRGVVAALAVAVAFAALFHAVPGLDTLRKPGFIVVFALGLAACALKGRLRAPATHAAIALAVVLAVACFQTDPQGHQLPRDLVFGVAFALVLRAVPAWPRLKALLETRWLASLGESAYSLYLVHVLVLQTILKTVAFGQPAPTLGASLVFMAIALPLAIAVARGFFVLFERPFFRRRHRAAERLIASA